MRQSRVIFPDPRTAGEDGIVGFGGNLDPDTLLTAYRMGIFPWPTKGMPLPWCCPLRRGVLDFKNLHIPKSLKKFKEKSDWTFTIDKAFPKVIRQCSERREEGTWINAGMIKAYTKLHEMGFVHSIEVWNGEKLIGGLYGVDAGGVFGGESMFYREPNASKLALLFLIEHLQKQGATWMDIQMVTPHMKALGGEEISRDEFLNRLQKAQAKALVLF